MPPAEVAPGLYLGDRRDAKDRAALRRLNIQSIVNCTPPKSEDPAAGCPSFFERELRYLRVPIYDSPAEDAAEHFDEVLDFIASRLHYGGVLVHCNRGVSRSATFVVAHLMKSRALDPAAALELVRAARPQAEPNAAFLKQLDVLHAELEASRKRDAQRMGGPVAPAKPPAPRPVARPARPERAGPAPRPLATAPARPERAIGAPARPERAGPAPRPLPTAPPRPERAIGAPPRPGADDDGRAEAFAAALERVAAAAAARPEKRPAIGPLPPAKRPK
jgi:dual specificity phosphatase 12